MSKWTGVITNVGNDLLGEWVNEKTLNFDNVMFGTGTVVAEAMMAQNDLVSQKQVASIVGSERTDSGIRLKIQITAADVSYVLNQIGVWASVENAEPVMLALYQYTTGVPVPSKVESPEFIYTFYALISTSNQGQWTINVDTSALVTREQLDSHVENKNNPHAVTAKQIGIDDVENLQLKKAICEATPDTLAGIIANAQPNTTINLTAGAYPLLLLSGKESFPDNLTIVGCKGATLAGVSITSGLQAYKDVSNNSDISEAILPRNLTFKDVAFSDSFCVRNCDITGLTIDECEFLEGTCLQILPNDTADLHGNDGSATFSEFPFYATRRAHNTVIRGCHFVNANTEAKTSAIYLVTVDGVVIQDNIVDAAAYNAVQISGTKKTSTNNMDALSTGRIAITRNTFKNTGSRSIRLNNFENADIHILYNNLYSADLIPTENNGIERIKITGCDTTTSIITTQYSKTTKTDIDINKYDDATIGVGNGITIEQSLTSVETSLQNHIGAENPHGMTIDKIGAAPAGYGLGDACTEIEDWNTAIENGFYFSPTKTDDYETANAPFPWQAAWGYTVAGVTDDAITQVAFTYAADTSKDPVTGRYVRDGLYQKIRYYKAIGGWSEWEWANPPMAPDVEYRTTERTDGKAVYTQLIDFGALPNADTKTVHKIPQNVTLVEMKGIITYTASGGNIISYPITSGTKVSDFYADVSSGYVGIKTADDLSARTAKIFVKYTKD